MDVFDGANLFVLVARLVVDLSLTWVIVEFAYKANRRFTDDLILTLYTLNVVTLALCLFLSRSSMKTGALGVFAVLGMLRYRAHASPIRDLSYLFLVIGIGVLGGLFDRGVALAEVLAVLAAAAGLTFLLDRSTADRVRTHVVYDNLELLSQGRELELHADLAHRTGLVIDRVEILRIDVVRECAEIVAHSRSHATKGSH